MESVLGGEAGPPGDRAGRACWRIRRGWGGSLTRVTRTELRLLLREPVGLL
ncbi:hypothetical protein [Embleya sp. NPDC005575]|uniref:hypothetical protein n=1 Tax=Embleya sp. NPDC005575 TaxID=3156892 RepID=UPI0033A7CC94